MKSLKMLSNNILKGLKFKLYNERAKWSSDIFMDLGRRMVKILVGELLM